MVIAAPAKAHAHKFNIVKNVGTCPCGEVREYIYADNPANNTFKVIKKGDQNYKDNGLLITNINSQKIQNEVEIKSNQPEKTKILTSSLPPVPPKPAGGRGNSKAIGQYYDDHRKEIESDIASLGLTASLKRWHIFSSTWSGLQKKWKRQDEIDRKMASLNKSFVNKSEDVISQKTFTPPTHSWTRVKWMRKHRAEILSDLDKFGPEPTMKRWGINKKCLGQLFKNRRVKAVANADPEAIEVKIDPASNTFLLSKLIKYWQSEITGEKTLSQKTLIDLTISELEKLKERS